MKGAYPQPRPQKRCHCLPILCLLAMVLGTSCKTHKPAPSHMVVSVADQRLSLVQNGKAVKTYAVSTSKFGLGDQCGSNKTPVGMMRVHQKVGQGARPGTVFKGRKPTGEVVKPDSPGRDPIVTRIMWLEGMQRSTKNAKDRYIYIHGTPEERNIGRPASYGCIRMRSKDIVDLYSRVNWGSTVQVKPSGLRLAEVPTQEKMLYASVRQREGGLSTPSRPIIAPVPASRPTRAPAFGAGSGEILAAAKPSRTPVKTPLSKEPAPGRSTASNSASSGEWRLSQDEARAMFKQSR